MESKRIKPILKWVGGKSLVLKTLLDLVPNFSGHYWEPFIGSGALGFALEKPNATLSDLNPELINVYKVLKSKNNVKKLIKYLEKIRTEYRSSNDPRSFFLQIKNFYNQEKTKKIKDKILLAVLFIFLNKTCFNAVMREDRNGNITCSYNKDIKTSFYNLDRIYSMSNYLQQKKIILKNKSFEHILKNAKKGDFVFLDPPYYPLNKNSYLYSQPFDHQKLIDLYKKLDKKGIKVMMTNSNTPFIRENLNMYRQIPITVKRQVSRTTDTRSGFEYNELVILNY